MKMQVAAQLTQLVALVLLGVRPLAAQEPLSPRLPEPLLRETPWGDFPLERLLPGARLRLTSLDGQHIERQLVALGDSVLELRAPVGDPTLRVSFTALRAYRKVEVRALPRWSDRVGVASVAGGVLLGAVAGAIVHNQRKPSSAAVHRHGQFDDIASVATIGGMVGWEIGIQTLRRPRWRPVTLP